MSLTKKLMIPATICAMVAANCGAAPAPESTPVQTTYTYKTVLVRSIGYQPRSYSAWPTVTFNWVSQDLEEHGCASQIFPESKEGALAASRAYADLSESKEWRVPLKITTEGIADDGCLSMIDATLLYR